ncbi:MAG: PfkB family carbohydrate kinase, partial [Actinomyces urogenitalis]
IAADGEQLLALPALDVPVVDTTGAGDAFAAGLTWALLEGADLRTALSAGQVTAAFTLTRPGGSLSAPRPADLRRMVEAYQVPEGYSLGFLDLAG